MNFNFLGFFTFLFLFSLTSCGVKSAPKRLDEKAISSYLDSYTHESDTEKETTIDIDKKDKNGK